MTSGKKEIQELKIAKAALDSLYFEHIYIVEEGSKELIYTHLFQQIQPCSVLVVGDRVSRDLLPGKKLGFSTVLVRQGRGLFQKFHKDEVDFVIQDVTELENLIKSFPNP